MPSEEGIRASGSEKQELEKAETGGTFGGSALLTLSLRRVLDIRTPQAAGEEPREN